MAYKALYRMYRPQTFEEVVGQQHIVVTLQNAIKTNKLSHAYLFSGPRGTGKTTVAKILGKAINCLSQESKPCEICASCQSINKGNHPDIIEIDAASNNGVDEIRELIDKVKYAPLELKMKVYIIDEVHMLTTGAFNALLKTLEEPPSHVMFILATTEPHKVIPTIISRCQRFDFTKVSMFEIQDRLDKILIEEVITAEKGVTRLIAQLADGGLRDALSILEQVIAFSGKNIKMNDVYQVYGLTTTQEKIDLLKVISLRQVKEILDFLKEVTIKSHDIKKLTVDLIECLKDGLIYYFTQSSENLSVLSVEEAQKLNNYFTADQSIEFMDILMDTLDKYRLSSNSISYFEVALLKMVHHLQSQNIQVVDTAKVKEVPSKVITKEPIIAKVESVPETISKQDDLKDDVISLLDDEPFKEVVEEAEEEMIESATDDLNTEATEVEKEEEDIKEVQSKPNETDLMDNLFDVQSNQSDKSASTTDLLLGLMQTADKEIRVNDEKLWKMKPYLHHLQFAKLARLLQSSTIKLSSTTFIVVIVDIEEEKHMISDPQLEPLIKEFTLEMFKVSKKLICVTKFEWSVALSIFMEIRDKKGQLPPPIHITLDEVDVLDDDQKLQLKLKEVVGHHVEVVIED
ncbi:MAG: DNA polymerase III subunit gamma/tau [Erysipelothrix sp.]|jgi:DNA polymerase-3 subunit gamma/tau|nr:DNA polymerase III subunit gamma/tau [Erysipelothrix sp.]